ncbi:hypothetical protein H4J58_12060 [Colwellia sp. MB3u-70]|uniref:hypothetical protein n=1 Tax=unclassified Colwellia TaxID=196834 RepID=UPI0015F5A2E5|nr:MULTISPECIES: hypothetical protein [unclassified Colwellia]MBA6293282.1 hypothetical protein [Colwellia sp. MB3u-8]MBA6307844.1 hypothetical protein [Colwellia sp. MB3u-70]
MTAKKNFNAYGQKKLICLIDTLIEQGISGGVRQTFFCAEDELSEKFLSAGTLGCVHYFVAQQIKICRLVFNCSIFQAVKIKN